jgi:peptide/nickel transport system permease protein
MSKQSSSSHRGRSQAAEIWKRLRKNKGALLGLAIITILVVIALTVPMWIDYDTQVITQNISERLQTPSAKHLMGTDDKGRDICCRLLYGTRYSLAVGFVAVSIALVLGVTLGSVAGFFGGAIENLIMRATDIFASVPSLLMGICIVSALGASTVTLMIAVGITSVPQFVRITRAAVLTVRGQDYVESAKAIGIPDWKIIMKHIVPNCLSPIIVQTTLRIGSAIITASSLSFLGMGVPSPAPEWGSMLSAGRNFLRGYSYMTFFPGLAIMITVLAFNLVGDGLRDAMDPKLKR